MPRVSAVATVALLVVVSACKADEPDTDSRFLGADGLPGDIRAALGDPANAAGDYELLVSAKGAASVDVCDASIEAGQCNTAATGHRSTTKVGSKDGIDIYEVSGTVNPKSGAGFVIVARNAAGGVIESQKIGFRPKGQVGQASQDTTGGTGGQKGSFEGTFGTNGRFLANVPQDNGPDKAHGLLILLHGSSRSSYDSFVQQMGAVAQQHGLIPVSVLAPNGQGWNEGDQNQAADYLDGLIQQKLYKEYNIDKRKIFFSGQSSGGGFLSSHFIPLKGNNYRGGAFLQCGMMPPQSQFTPSEAMKTGFRLHFEITTGDGIWTQYFSQAVERYRAAGLTVTFDNTKPGGHCAFDQALIIQQRITEMLPK